MVQTLIHCVFPKPCQVAQHILGDIHLIPNHYTMSVNRCHICDSNPEAKRRFQGDGLPDGKECPICYSPTCRYHLTTVRWRWKETGETEATQICKNCKRTYQHRDWDTLNREWIS